MSLSRRLARRLAVAVVGSTLLIAGVILWVTPIPVGFILVPTALIILAAEFAWARSLLHHIKTRTGPVGRAIACGESAARRKLTRHRQPSKPTTTEERSADETDPFHPTDA